MFVSRRNLLKASATGAAAFVLDGRAAQAADKNIVLGCSLPLSGPAAPTGITTQRTIQHAVDLINQKGVVIGTDRYDIKAVFYDNEYVPAVAVSVVQKMLSDGVRYIFSSGSGNSVPVVAQTTAVKALQLSGASGSNDLTAPQFPYSFRVEPCNETAYAVYPWLRATYPNVKRVAELNPSDEAGFTESATRRMLAKQMGFTVVANEHFKRGSTDYYPVATRVVADKPDLIDFGGTIGRDQGLACMALRQLGYKGLILIGYADAASFVKIAGPSAAEGTLLFDTLAAPQNAAETELTNWWLKKYGPPFPSYAYLMWDWPFMLAEAMRQAKSVDPVVVASALRTLRYPGLFGEVSFGMKSLYGIASSITRPIPMAIIKGGVPVPLTVVPWPASA